MPHPDLQQTVADVLAGSLREEDIRSVSTKLRPGSLAAWHAIIRGLAPSLWPGKGPEGELIAQRLFAAEKIINLNILVPLR